MCKFRPNWRQTDPPTSLHCGDVNTHSTNDVYYFQILFYWVHWNVRSYLYSIATVVFSAIHKINIQCKTEESVDTVLKSVLFRIDFFFHYVGFVSDYFFFIKTNRTINLEMFSFAVNS